MANVAKGDIVRTKRLIFFSHSSPCHQDDEVLVHGPASPFITRNCLTCGVDRTLRPEELPVLQCEVCYTDLGARKNGEQHYAYFCGKCFREWDLAEILPSWAELRQSK